MAPVSDAGHLTVEELVDKYVALIAQGPSWIQGRSGAEQGKPLEDHFAAMGAHFAAGRLQLGGPFAGGGGMAILTVDDEAAARAVMDADPAVVAGVLVYELKTFEPVFEVTGDLPSVVAGRPSP